MSRDSAKLNKIVGFTRAAEEVGVDRQTLKKAVALGQIRAVKLGSREYILRNSLSKLMGEKDG
jgi:predicted site-specific integrase-resolvase